MSSVEGVLKTIQSTKRVTVTFQPEPWLRDELQTQMRLHKLNKSGAIHYGFKEWMTLRELKPSLTPASSAQPEAPSSSWQEIDCRFLSEAPKKAHDCLSKNPPIRVTHPLISPEVCKACQNEVEEIKQVAKTLVTFNLNARTKAPIAQIIHGLETQLGIVQEQSRKKEQTIEDWKITYSEACAKNRSLNQQLQAWEDRDAKLRGRERALEETDQEYSEKREALQELPALRKQVETLEAENRNLKENPMVLCPDERLVRLSFCMKTCNKILACEVYMTNYQISKYTLNENLFNVSRANII